MQGEELPTLAGQDPARVCTLPPEGLEDRLAWIRTAILPHAVETERLPDGLALELRAAPGVADALDRLVALEKECCGSIGFVHRAGREPERRRLEIHGVDPDAGVFRDFQATESSPPYDRPTRRLLKAAGVGLLASLIVCCVLPIGAAALLGAAAAPLAGLDAPAPIAAGALLGGLGAWWWLGRARPSATSGCGPDC
ncbi:MAG: hypothetical protein QNK05_03030 [Myxococcota bacterium]|nr:hypothetical protein [Myxococcota bacterium]